MANRPVSSTGVAFGTVIRVDYDHAARASYQRVSDKPLAGSREREDGAIIDLAADGSVIGIERLY